MLIERAYRPISSGAIRSRKIRPIIHSPNAPTKARAKSRGLLGSIKFFNDIDNEPVVTARCEADTGLDRGLIRLRTTPGIKHNATLCAIRMLAF